MVRVSEVGGVAVKIINKGAESWISGCRVIRDEVWYDFFPVSSQTRRHRCIVRLNDEVSCDKRLTCGSAEAS
jgi:hypothetical protein